MIQFEDSEHIVIIKDDLAEAIIKMAQRWKGKFEQGFEKRIIDDAVSQMEDDSNHIRFCFAPDEDTVIGLGLIGSRISFAVAKKSVTIRDKRKKVRIKEGSLYEGLNDNPRFIESLAEEYNTNYDYYAYYLPVTYRAHLVHKEGDIGDFLKLRVDIPFSDIEVY